MRGLCVYLLLLLSDLWAAPTAGAAPAPPRLLLLDSAALATVKVAYQQGQAAAVRPVKALLAAADKALTRVPDPITSKPQVPPSGDKHDYLSQAPYWWPDPNRPNGKPYIQKDGLRNPESVNMRDGARLAQVCHDARLLGLAYYFSGQEAYAAHAARQLRVFFLDPATRMNPNLNFGQGIPGSTTGRGFGIIETRHLTEIPDALALLHGSRAADEKLTKSIRGWFRQFTSWLLTSPIGQQERGSENNHGTFYDLQVVDFARFTGDAALARTTLQTQTLPRIGVQFAPDGSQPLELERTRPWNYTSMNLEGWVKLAILAQPLGLDLWHYRTPDGRGLEPAVAWFTPYLLGQRQLERPDVMPVSNRTILAIYNRVRPYYPALPVATVMARFPAESRLPWEL
ncbi:alginate lyase family protein [Hymenobacter lapidiphilus]|uniref:Alginate lyase family protein n=1 Tax=Hymenobacter lapidiphilus TaxID=2608003 RepID=A0A7Y7U5L8_9BACT|nr:alginate lyase family protein [Hymenobacter lapidiphilus]NVO31861.1 alginate lyase family protein [Hymenobacter lapidiphilus]